MTISNTNGEHYLFSELKSLLNTDESLFNFLESSALDGVWFWDLEEPENGWMSPTFWKILGFDPDSKRHLRSEWQDLVNREDVKDALDNLEQHYATPSSMFDQIIRYTHKNGHTVWVRCRGVAI